MEFEPGCELQPADELRQAKAHTAGRWKEASPDLYYLASFGWFRGWPLAKSAAMEAEREVQQFAVSWAEAWARAEVRAWAQVKATLVVEVGKVGEVEMRGAAEALLLGEAWGEARAQARGECVPDRLADPQTIADMHPNLPESISYRT